MDEAEGASAEPIPARASAGPSAGPPAGPSAGPSAEPSVEPSTGSSAESLGSNATSDDEEPSAAALIMHPNGNDEDEAPIDDLNIPPNGNDEDETPIDDPNMHPTRDDDESSAKDENLHRNIIAKLLPYDHAPTLSDVLADEDPRGTIVMNKAAYNYMTSVGGSVYLDCISATAIVYNACRKQMAELTSAQGFVSHILAEYVSKLVDKLPRNLNVCFLCNSGSEANDLAIKLARKFTGGKDVVVHEDSYFGNLGTLVDVSPGVHKSIPKYKKKKWVHILPVPNYYSGKYRSTSGSEDEATTESYLKDAREKISSAAKSAKVRGGLACLLLEPWFVLAGVHKPSKHYIQGLVQFAHKNRAVVIADETGTALGRIGGDMWGFNALNIIPDIVTVGNVLGNGHPLAAVICTENISNSLKDGYFSTFGGNPVACAVGKAVLDEITSGSCLTAAINVGRYLEGLLRELKTRYPRVIGDIRGSGHLWAIEIVSDPKIRKPDPDMAQQLMYGLRYKKVLVGLTGRYKNIILVQPSLNFNLEESTRFCEALEFTLGECTSAKHPYFNLERINPTPFVGGDASIADDDRSGEDEQTEEEEPDDNEAEYKITGDDDDDMDPEKEPDREEVKRLLEKYEAMD